ncbi:DUF7847 domain-containing protein [Candidatus Pyrohabitans sp.]
MGVLTSFVTAWKLVLTREALLIPALIYSIISLPQLLMQFFYSGESGTVMAAGAAYSIVIWLITPFFTGGLLATAARAIRGEVDLNYFVSSGRKRYLSLLLAGVIYMLAVGASLMVLLLLALVMGAGVGAVLSGDLGAVFALVFLLLGGLLLILVAIMLNFYDVGVAIDGLDPVKTFKNSFSFVMSRPLSVFAFLLLSYSTVAVIYFPVMAVFFYHLLTNLPELTLEEFAAGRLPAPDFQTGVLITLLLIITGTLTTCFTNTYRAVFYVNVRR